MTGPTPGEIGRVSAVAQEEPRGLLPAPALRYTAESVEAALLREDTAEPGPFSGWLELLRLLEHPERAP